MLKKALLIGAASLAMAGTRWPLLALELN